MKIINNLIKSLLFTTVVRSVVAEGNGVRFPFTDALYNGRPQTGKCHERIPAVFYNNFDADTIAGTLRECPKVNRQFSSLQLPTTHIAAMAGNEEGLKQLLDANADINAQDGLGHTLLHVLALKGNTAGIDILKAKGANPNIRSHNGVTYMDFLRMTAPFRPDYPLNSTLFSTHTGESHSVQPQSKCLGEATELVHENVVSPNKLTSMVYPQKRHFHLDMYHQTNAHILHDFFLEQYAAFKNNPPQLAIFPVSKDDRGSATPLDGKTCGVTATQLIKRGQIVAEYVGKIGYDNLMEEHSGDATYRLIDYPPIDSIKYRSVGAMVNDGFPNVGLIHLSKDKEFKMGLDGLPSRKLFVAVEDIQPGQPILWDYGPGDATKSNDHVELRPQALSNFLTQNSWKDLLAAFKQFMAADLSIDQRLKIYDKLIKMYYIGNTPATQKLLLAKKFYTPKDRTLFIKAIKSGALDLLTTSNLKGFISRMDALQAKTEL